MKKILIIIILATHFLNAQVVIVGGNLKSYTKKNGVSFLSSPNNTVFSTNYDNTATYTMLDNDVGIIEGVVSDEVAAANTTKLEQFFINGKNEGYTNFSINFLDAYFKTDNFPELPWTAAINIPGDVYLTMTDNTHLRTQPNAYRSTTLIAIVETSNVTIDGGFLHGDRDTHDYSSGGTHEWGHLLRVTASQDVTIMNMTTMDAGGDSFDIHSTKHSTAPDYIPSENVTFLNNKVIRARRNGISVTDGVNIIIDGNEFIDNGIDTQNSTGILPRWAIDIEEAPLELVNGVVIRNNIEKGSELGAFLIFAGDNVLIENNTTESTIAVQNTNGSIVRNNVMTAIEGGRMNINGAGISGLLRADENYNNQIYGNIITNFAFGIRSFGINNNFYNNTINNFLFGLSLRNSKNTNIYGNNFSSNRLNSVGIISNADYLDNVVIGAKTTENNTINNKNIFNVVSNPFIMQDFNTAFGQEDYELIIKNNEFTSSNNTNSNLFNATGFNFINNELQDQFFLYSINDCFIDNNNIGSFRMGISSSNSLITNSTISNNFIDSGCVDTPTDSFNLIITGNICN